MHSSMYHFVHLQVGKEVDTGVEHGDQNSLGLWFVVAENYDVDCWLDNCIRGLSTQIETNTPQFDGARREL